MPLRVTRLGPHLPLRVDNGVLRLGRWQGFEYLKLKQNLSLDGVDYPVIDSEDVPTGFCEVDVKVDDNGTVLDCMMVSGHLATRVEGNKRDSVRPIPSWFMFVKSDVQGSK